MDKRSKQIKLPYRWKVDPAIIDKLCNSLCSLLSACKGCFPLGEQRKKQLDWLVTNTDDIISQSHSVFACSREQIRSGKLA